MDVVESGDMGAEGPAIVSTPEAATPAVNVYSLRGNALNFLRFASVLVGAGLLLRVGASEQANSAIDDEKAPAEKPQRTRIAMPEPAFGLQAVSSGNAAITKNLAALPAAAQKLTTAQKIAKIATVPGKGASMPAQAPMPSFASVFGPGVDGVAESASARSARMADSQSGSMALAKGGAAKSRLEGRSPARGQDANQLVLDASVRVPASAATPGTVARAKPSVASKAVQSIALTNRRTAADGLLAPVRITSASNGSLLAPVRATSANTAARSVGTGGSASAPITVGPLSASSTPVTAPMVKEKMKPAAGLPANASLANAKPQTAPLAPSGANPNASAVIPKPLQISLEAPVMTRGPRTTVLTSNIADVMRRPASAWEYAEALSPELSGAVRRNASAQPSVEVAPARTAAVAPPSPSAPRQIIAGPVPRVSAAQPVQVAPSRAGSVPADRPVAVQSQAVAPAPNGAKITLAQPYTAQPQTGHAEKVQRTAALTSEHRAAALSPRSRALPVYALNAVPANVGPASSASQGFKRDEDELEATVPHSVNYEANAPSTASTAGDSPATEATTLSLLDRMPHPAF